MKGTLALISLVMIFSANAGQPLHEVLKLRTIKVLGCDAVTPTNVAAVSSFVRGLPTSDGLTGTGAEIADSVPGFIVKGVVLRQRDLAFPILGSEASFKSAPWGNGLNSEPIDFFTSTTDPDACRAFLERTPVNVVLSQRAECDTYPPAGVCAFDYPIRLVDSETWIKYGE